MAVTAVAIVIAIAKAVVAPTPILLMVVMTAATLIQMVVTEATLIPMVAALLPRQSLAQAQLIALETAMLSSQESHQECAPVT